MKDFDRWNVLKKELESRDCRPLFKEREVWFCCLGVNIGNEQDGKGDLYLRPMLVLKKFNENIFIGISITSRQKNLPFYLRLKNRSDYLILSQIKLMDSKRLKYLARKIGKQEFKCIKEKIRALIL